MRPRFAASDLQTVTGRFHTVACIDVLIHYPQARLLGFWHRLGLLACSGCTVCLVVFSRHWSCANLKLVLRTGVKL